MDQTRILMRARLVAVGLLVALIVTSGCGGGQAHWLESSPPAEHGLPADLPKRIDAYAHEHAPELHAVLVVADDRLVAERYYGGVTYFNKPSTSSPPTCKPISSPRSAKQPSSQASRRGRGGLTRRGNRSNRCGRRAHSRRN
jgi:hypothetical protein